MTIIKGINLCKGSKFDTCSACGTVSEEAKLFRIKTVSELGQDINICFCENCAKIVLKSLEEYLYYLNKYE